jgi:anthranilate/para-aminobenzoate synthase component I
MNSWGDRYELRPRILPIKRAIFISNQDHAWEAYDFEALEEVPAALDIPIAEPTPASHPITTSINGGWDLDLLEHQKCLLGLVSYDQVADAPLKTAPNRWIQCKLRRTRIDAPQSAETVQLQALSSDQNYLSKCNQLIDEIKNGRYYELNLLRYYDVTSPVDVPTLLPRILATGGAYSAILQYEDLDVFSFSPEEFIRIHPEKDYLKIKTYPIKGTRGRHPDSEQDRKLAEDLRLNPKDRSELNMIIDLMRNDFFRICAKGSVHVEDVGTLHSFSTVHHLIAEITGILQTEISVADVLRWVFPAGSITGAPKVEVIKAISQLEGRPRDYFMGNIVLYFPEQSVLKSSVLIRTIVGNPLKNHYQYAAGGGVVVRSNAHDELLEIQQKCRVLTGKLLP